MTETMIRVTPSRLLKAYEKTGLTPGQGAWFRKIDGDDCACAFTAMAAAEHDKAPWDCPAAVDEMAQYTGVSWTYMIGFLRVWDSSKEEAERLLKPEFMIDEATQEIMGREDAIACRKAVEEQMGELVDMDEENDWDEDDDEEVNQF